MGGKPGVKKVNHSEATIQGVVDDLVAGLSAKQISYKWGVSYSIISHTKKKYTTTIISRNDIPIERRFPDEPELALELFKN